MSSLSILFLHGQVGSIQSDEHHGEKIDYISRIDDALGDIFEVGGGSEVGDCLQGGIRKKEKHIIDQREAEADGRADDKCDDLVSGQR